MPDNVNGWETWSKYVLKELERLNDCYEKLDKKVDIIRNDIIILKVKAGIWGAFAGAIPVIIMIAVKYFSGG